MTKLKFSNNTKTALGFFSICYFCFIIVLSATLLALTAKGILDWENEVATGIFIAITSPFLILTIYLSASKFAEPEDISQVLDQMQYRQLNATRGTAHLLTAKPSAARDLEERE